LNIEKKVVEELKVILRSKGKAGRDRYVQSLRDWLYTESKRVQDEQMEELLRDKNNFKIKVY